MPEQAVNVAPTQRISRASLVSAAVPAPKPRVVNGLESTRHRVVIGGGGPVGLAMSLYLARAGIDSVVIDADDDVCAGSRAIGISRRSLELLDQLAAVEPFIAKGLTRLGSRAFYNGDDIGFRPLRHPVTDKFPPMINLQQSYAELFLLQQLENFRESVVRWSSTVTAVEHIADGARLSISGADGDYQLETDWLIACDGANSTTRRQLGQQLEGTAYADRYLIADVRMKSSHPSERRIWYNPASNPGSTVIMHKQPDDIWRIDFRLLPEDDLAEAMREDVVLERVTRHLALIGETAPWEPSWISSYQARALSLREYRQGKVLFAGDAAHLVPIFGARGMNSGLEDVFNLGWKLARVVNGTAADSLLDSYSVERRAAALVNMRLGSMGAEFVGPQSWGAEIMREAVLRLLPNHPRLESLIDPRTSDPSSYPESPLNAPSDEIVNGVEVGSSMKDAPVIVVTPNERSRDWLTKVCGTTTTVVYFGSAAPIDEGIVDQLRGLRSDLVSVVVVTADIDQAVIVGFDAVTVDDTGAAHRLYGAVAGTVYVLRPDQFVAGRWLRFDHATVAAAVESLGSTTTPESAVPR